MNKIIKTATNFALIFVATLFLMRCASVNNVSVTSIPAKRDNSFKVSVSRVVFLWFNFDNDYIDDLYEKIKNACPGMKATGILTKDEVYAYLVVFKRVVTATGYCVPSDIK
ncbi:MAG: hypothetical protein NZ480_09640 [Bdellovibrionaceae bacterium]|nr:hypothetical protein [Pseudobdellovibrionaceae bacterium]MDW8190750.1 hypothetical protein [Pseudobdellovibrionaceae bacterium]